MLEQLATAQEKNTHKDSYGYIFDAALKYLRGLQAEREAAAEKKETGVQSGNG